MDLFNKFFDFELNGTKGAIRYLVKSLDKNFSIKDVNLYSTYLLNILVNDDRSLTKVCDLLISVFNNESVNFVDAEFTNRIYILLNNCIDSSKDLETIWVLYLIKQLNITPLSNEIIEKILKSNNQLAIIIFIRDFPNLVNTEQIHSLIITFKLSWILLYQLYYDDYIDIKQFKNQSGLNSNYTFYEKLKENKFTFYKTIAELNFQVQKNN